MKYSVKHDSRIREEIEQMDVDGLLGVILCPDVPPDSDLPRNTAAALVYPTIAEKAKQTASGINDGRERRALIVSDMEYGAGCTILDAVRFPSMWAAAVAGDESLAYQMGAIAAKEARRVGYHWAFGPCVDIVGNPENPIVGIRAAGDDPDTVIRYGGAYMRGLQDNGLIATLKHFPGDGYCTDDQHITTPCNPLSKEEWDATFGRVYAALIEQGAMAIMPGHIALPAYDYIDDATGLYPPATLSKHLLTGLLREQLGFEGIIVSDAVNMNGFCGYRNLYHACADFLEAGGDCLLFMQDTEEYRTAMKACIAEGRLRIETLKDRAYRMSCFAHEYFEKHPIGETVAFDRTAAEAVAKEMTEKAVTVCRNRAGTLPLAMNKATRIAHVVLYSPWEQDRSVTAELTAKLSALVGTVEEFCDPGAAKLIDIAKSGLYDVILCSVSEAAGYGLNTAKLCGPMARNMMGGWMRFSTPVVFISYRTAYFGDTYEACVDTMINTYGVTEYTVDAVIRRLCGWI